MVLVLNKDSKKSDLDNFLKKLESRKKKMGFDPTKFLGTVKSFEKIDPVKYQRKLRNEW